LTAKDLEFTDTTHFRRYTLPVRARQTLTIDLRSDDFDAFLLLERGRGERLVENDDGGGGCHARIVYTTVEDRPLAVVVNTAVARQTGGFTVSVRNGASPTEPKSTCRTAAHAIRVGQTRTGALGADDRLVTRDSTYAQEWRLEGRQGQAVTVDLASKEFDAFLFVMGPGIESALQNDDAGGSCNARLSFTFREDGTYYIFVNSAQKHATGAFTLEVTPGTKPPSLVRCARGR
jgi:hypothetical protein